MTSVRSDEWAADQISTALALARSGDVDAAEEVVREVRRRVVVEVSPRIAIGSIFVEGVISAYRADWREARDKFLRAEALSRGQQPLHSQALAASAWLAFVESNTGDLHSAGRRAASVLKQESQLDSHTACRAGLVLATLLQHAGDNARANVWYSYARRKAEEARDSSLVSIVIFDAAVMRILSARIARYLGEQLSSDFRLEVIFAESSANYDRISGVRVLAPLYALLQVQILNLQAEHQRAMEVAQSLISNPGGLSVADLLRVKLEYILAKSRLAADDINQDDIELIEGQLNQFSDADDLAIACAMISDIFLALGEDSRSKLYSERATDYYKRHVEWRTEFRGFLVSQLPVVQ